MRSILPLFAALLACAVLAPAANAAPLFGFNDSAVIWNQLSASADAKLAAGAGAGTTRITVDWRWAEATPGVWNLATYDAMYNAAVANGQKPTIVLLFAPRWTWAEGTSCVSDCRFPPSALRMDAWRNAVRTMVRRYPQMAALEVWNEPNVKQYWQSGADPELYTTMVKEAYATRARRGLDGQGPGRRAERGRTTRIEAAGRPVMSYRQFLQGMYDNGVKGQHGRDLAAPVPGRHRPLAPLQDAHRGPRDPRPRRRRDAPAVAHRAGHHHDRQGQQPHVHRERPGEHAQPHVRGAAHRAQRRRRTPCWPTR